MGMGMGSSILLAQYYGAKNMDGVRRTVETTYIFLFWASLVVTAVGLTAGGAILRFLHTPPEILPQARLYLNILFAGLILLFGYNSLAAILRGLGDSKTPLYFLIVATADQRRAGPAVRPGVPLGGGGGGLGHGHRPGPVLPAGGAGTCAGPSWPCCASAWSACASTRRSSGAPSRSGCPRRCSRCWWPWACWPCPGSSTLRHQRDRRLHGGHPPGDFRHHAGHELRLALSAFVGQNVGAGRLDRVRRGFFFDPVDVRGPGPGYLRGGDRSSGRRSSACSTPTPAWRPWAPATWRSWAGPTCCSPPC